MTSRMDIIMNLSCVVVFLSLLNSSHCISYNKSAQLIADILTGYEARQRPLLNQSHTLNVSVSFYLSSFRELDEVTGKFSVIGALLIQWTDEKISWVPAQYGGAAKTDLKINDIWYPQIVLSNPYSTVGSVGQNWMKVTVRYDGEVTYWPGSLFESTCSVDVTFYPFDIQDCCLQFVVFGYSSADVRLYPTGNEVISADLIENGEWSFESSSVIREVGSSPPAPDKLICKFRLRRRSRYLLTNLILPIVFMALINLLVFILPAESGERVSFSVTVLLALAVYMTIVGENLPKTSEPMSVLSFYLLTIMLMSVCITVTTVINLQIYHRDCKVSQCYESFAKKIICARSRKRKIKDIGTGFGIENEDEIVTQDETAVKDCVPVVTWHVVSSAVDRTCLVLFSLINVLVNMSFLIFLTSN